MAFETWAVVEIMGHVSIAGKVIEETIAGTQFLRVDVPKTSRREPFTKYYGPSAIYSITPTDEATATAAAEYFNQAAVPPHITRMPENSLLAEKVINVDDDRWDNDDEF